MNALLWVSLAIVGINAVVLAALLVHYKKDQGSEQDGEEFDRVVDLVPPAYGATRRASAA